MILKNIHLFIFSSGAAKAKTSTSGLTRGAQTGGKSGAVTGKRAKRKGRGCGQG